jgi:hypothetical protein
MTDIVGANKATPSGHQHGFLHIGHIYLLALTWSKNEPLFT